MYKTNEYFNILEEIKLIIMFIDSNDILYSDIYDKIYKEAFIESYNEILKKSYDEKKEYKFKEFYHQHFMINLKNRLWLSSKK